ncbi:hypothetical protein KJ633_06770 [bacterium]|nr:hypothetical protein [bacterium]MBU3956149.1 hypothetical protein [bacterium]
MDTKKQENRRGKKYGLREAARAALFLLVFSLPLKPVYGDEAQRPEGFDTAVWLKPSSTYTLIGEAFAVKAVITKEADHKVEKIMLPAPPNIKFAIIRHKRGAKDDEVDLELRFFDLGEIEVPSPEFVVSSSVVRGKTFKVLVKGRLAPAETEIKKLRAQRGGAFPFKTLVGALLLIAAAYYFLRKKKTPVPPEKLLSPEEWYRRELDGLDKNASAAEVLDGLSDTFRRYLEKKHDFPAIFLDTREIEKEMKKRVFTTEERIKSVSFLRSCDLAKFAKKQFMPAEIEKLFKDAYAFTEIGGERK